MNIEPIQPKTYYQPLNSKAESSANVNKGALIGSIVGVGLTATSILYASSKKIPNFKLTKFHYNDKQLILLGGTSVLGGLIGGIKQDKVENAKYKYREAMHQFFGNIITPIAVLGINSKILDATHILQKVKPLTGNIINTVVTVGSLILGMETGNKIVGAVTNKIFGDEVKHKVKIEDYSVHADDICMTISHIGKGSKISTLAAHLMPAAFLLSGYKTGSAKAPADKN